MTITTRDGIANALGNAPRKMPINKASIANTGAGQYAALWRATGSPTQGAIPGAAAVCDKALAGTFPFATVAAQQYLARACIATGNAATNLEFDDRLAHMGGLSGVTTTSQTVGVDVSGSGSNLNNRRGAADFSEVQWWIEIYTDIGTTAVTATITYTNAAGTSGQTTTVSLGGASPLNRASRRIPIFGNGGERIQSIQSIIHATTGTAGSYGITATRLVAEVPTVVANKMELFDWAQTGLAKVVENACLEMAMLCSTTTTGTVMGSCTLVDG